MSAPLILGLSFGANRAYSSMPAAEWSVWYAHQSPLLQTLYSTLKAMKDRHPVRELHPSGDA